MLEAFLTFLPVGGKPCGTAIPQSLVTVVTLVSTFSLFLYEAVSNQHVIVHLADTVSAGLTSDGLELNEDNT
jgi:hypothetical protein